MTRITCRYLAQQLGVSVMTVSRALRDHPSLPLKTRERVQALATELGYRPDPALAALNAYRHSKHAAAYQATLAWVNTFPRREVFHQVGGFDQYVEGMRVRADELGFQLEEFWLPAVEDWKRLARTLRARRIEGIIVPPPPAHGVEGYRIFPWQDFFAIAVGTAFGLSLHLVENDQFQSAALAVKRLHALGYHRIGLEMTGIFAAHTDYHFLGGYHAECARLKIPSLVMLDESSSEDAYHKSTLAWMRRERLDAVVAAGPGDILPILERGRLKAPDDIAVAFLARQEGYPHYAGIDQNNHQIGISAANQLVDLIRHNERGIPELPLRRLIPGTWIDGDSAPPQRTSRQAKT